MYTVLPGSWGQGFATEAAGALLDCGVSELGVSRIVAFVVPESVPSARVAEKIGMRYQGMVEHRESDRPVRLYAMAGDQGTGKEGTRVPKS